MEDPKNYVVNEANVVDFYKALMGNKEIDEEELNDVKKRFFELVNFKNEDKAKG